MKKYLILILSIFCVNLYAQNGNWGLRQFETVSALTSYAPSCAATSTAANSSKLAYVANVKNYYRWDCDNSTWRPLSDIIITTDLSTPSITCNSSTNVLVINAAKDLYICNGTSWQKIGTTVVTNATLTGDGSSGSPLSIAQQGASSGQVLKWNGTTWAPAADNTGGGGGGATDLGVSNRTSTTLDVTSTTGTSATIPVATTSLAGLLSSSDKTKLDALPASAGLTISAGGTENLAGQTLNVVASGIASVLYTPASNELLIGATEIDGSTSNEGYLSLGAATGNTTDLISSTSGSPAIRFAGSGITWSESGNTITATAIDASASNELQDLTVASNVIGLTGGVGATVTVAGAGINSVSTVGSTITVTGTEVDGSTSNEGALSVGAGTGTTSIINSNTTGSTGVTLTASTGLTIAEAGNVITLTNSSPDQTVSLSGTGITVGGTYPSFTLTAADQSATNELQTVSSTSDATTHTLTLSNSGGSIQLVEGSNISLTTTGTASNAVVTIASTGTGTTDLTVSGAASPLTLNSSSGTDVTVNAGSGISLSGTSSSMTITNTGDLSTTNEPLTVTDGTNTETLAGQTLTFVGNGIVTTTYVPASNSLVVNAVESDSDIANEGLLTVGAGTGTNSIINSNTSGSTGVTIQGTTGILVTEAGNTITLTAADNSNANELQTVSNTSDATSHTVTLSNAGGSVKLVEGSNITLTTSGTSGDGIVTIAATGTGNTDLTVSGTSSPLTLNSSTGTDVTVTAGTGITLAGTSGNMTITNSGDLSTTNELQTISVASNTATLSNSGGSVTIAGAGINSVATAGSTITVTGTEVDGSITNENLTLTDGTNSENLGGQTLTVTGSGGAVVSYSPATNTLTINAGSSSGGDNWGSQVVSTGAGLTGNGTAGSPLVATDASISNEGALTVGVGTSTSSIIASNTSGSTNVTLNTGTGLSISETGNDITLTNTAPDQTVALSGTGITVGGTYPSFTLTAADQSNANEGSLTVDAGTTTTSIINSNTTGSTGVTLTAGTGLSISEVGNVITMTNSSPDQTVSISGTGITVGGTYPAFSLTAADQSATNEAQTLSAGGTTSPTVSLNQISGAGGGTITFASSGIVSLNQSGGTITVGAIESDGSTTNELQTISVATNTATLSNGGGSVTIAGAGTNSVSTVGSTITVTGNGLSTTLANNNILVGNASNVATAVNPSGDADVSNTGVITVDKIDGTNVTATGATAEQLMRWNNTTSTWEPSNEKEQSIAVVGTTSPQLELTGNDGVSGSAGSIIVNGVRGITVSNNAGDIDIALPAVGSAGNILVSNGSSWIQGPNPNQSVSVDPMSGLNPNISLTNNAGTTGGGGTIQMVGVAPLEVAAAGSSAMNVRISTTGASAGQVIKFDGTAWGFGTDNTGGAGSTDLTFSGASSPYTLNSSSGTDVTFTNGPGVLITRTSNDLQIEAYDISNSNEGSLTVGAGTSTTSIINSNTASSTGVTLTAGTGLSIAEVGNVITLTNSAPDQTVSITGGGISAVTGTYPSFTVTSTEVDGLTTNEGTLGVGAGSTTSSTLLTNTSGGNAVTINATSGINIAESTSSNGGSISLSFAYSLREENFTSTAGQTSFTIAYTPPAASGTAIPIRVFRNGVKLDWVASGPTGTQFTYTGTSVTTAANTSGDIIRVEYLN